MKKMVGKDNLKAHNQLDTDHLLKFLFSLFTITIGIYAQ